MKDAAHLVSRCVYLNILRMTEIPDLLEKFITEGGWDTINKWLIEAKNSENMAFILEVLKVTNNIYEINYCLNLKKFPEYQFCVFAWIFAVIQLCNIYLHCNFLS